eukprot:gene2704-5322_t
MSLKGMSYDFCAPKRFFKFVRPNLLSDCQIDILLMNDKNTNSSDNTSSTPDIASSNDASTIKELTTTSKDTRIDEAMSSSKKRKRPAPGVTAAENEVDNNIQPSLKTDIDPELYLVDFPEIFEREFISAVFDHGLKSSSPKLIMQLMPKFESLTLEHIKSHLQKCRLHTNRSKEDFMKFYYENIHNQFKEFVTERGWEKIVTKQERIKDKSSPEKKEQPEVPVQEKTEEEKALEDTETVLLQVEDMMSDWSTLFQNLMTEHAVLQHIIATTIENDIFDSEEEGKHH